MKFSRFRIKNNCPAIICPGILCQNRNLQFHKLCLGSLYIAAADLPNRAFISLKGKHGSASCNLCHHPESGGSELLHLSYQLHNARIRKLCNILASVQHSRTVRQHNMRQTSYFSQRISDSNSYTGPKPQSYHAVRAHAGLQICHSNFNHFTHDSFHFPHPSHCQLSAYIKPPATPAQSKSSHRIPGQESG